MTATLQSALIFLLGAFTTAVIGALIRRVFEGSRVYFAISDLAIVRTPDRYGKVLLVSAKLRRLLSKRPLKSVDWERSYFSEHELELAILETLEGEQQAKRAKEEFKEYLSRIAQGDSVRTIVYDFACDRMIGRFARSALIEDQAGAEKIPAPTSTTVLFPLRKIDKNTGSETKTLICLDLPGNALPIVGSEIGDTDINRKVELLTNGLSYGDDQTLQGVFHLGFKFTEEVAREYAELRQCLQSEKDLASFLRLDVFAANMGKEPALLSQFGSVHFEFANDTIPLKYVEPSLEESRGDPNIGLPELTVRLRELGLLTAEQLNTYLPVMTYVALLPNEAKRLHFVSTKPLSSDQKMAVQALRSGHTDCTISLIQHVPRVVQLLPKAAVYTKRIRRRQRLEVSNAKLG